jgi:hypothetical protein
VPLLTSFTIGASEPSVPGQNTAGRLTLSAPAVSPVVVTLTASDNQAVTVPPSITVSGGAVMATVPILTRRVPADTDVTVTASANDSSVTSSLRVGSESFLAYASPPGDSIGQGLSRRMNAADFALNATTSAALNGIAVTSSARSGSTAGSWTLILSVPTGSELRPGFFYGDALTSPSGGRPGLQFNSAGRFCSSGAGSFVIVDLAFGVDPHGPVVDRLHAQFTESCQDQPPITGEVYLSR